MLVVHEPQHHRQCMYFYIMCKKVLPVLSTQVKHFGEALTHISHHIITQHNSLVSLSAQSALSALVQNRQKKKRRVDHQSLWSGGAGKCLSNKKWRWFTGSKTTTCVPYKDDNNDDWQQWRVVTFPQNRRTYF